eukprot:3911471-Ditylum_brightwellii.AAC.1
MKSVQVQTSKSATESVSVLTDPTATTALTESKSTAETHQEESSSDESNETDNGSNVDENDLETKENIEHDDNDSNEVADQNRKLISQETKDRKTNLLKHASLLRPKQAYPIQENHFLIRKVQKKKNCRNKRCNTGL